MLSNATTLNELGVTSGSPVTLVIQPPPPPPTAQPLPAAQLPSLPVELDRDMIIDIITTQIQAEGGGDDDDDIAREILIKIERSNTKKPFLGGYKHRVNGVEYHHASAQTLPKSRLDKGVSGIQWGTFE